MLPISKSLSTASARMRILDVCGAYNFHNPGSQTSGKTSALLLPRPRRGRIRFSLSKNLCKSASSAVNTA